MHDHDVPKLSQPRMSAAEVNLFLAQVFPQIAIGRAYTVEETRHGFARMRMVYGDHLLRPGGTISGPAMFSLADVAMYAAVLASIGPVAHAVTTNLTINFLRKPDQRDMIGEARLLELAGGLQSAKSRFVRRARRTLRHTPPLHTRCRSIKVL